MLPTRHADYVYFEFAVIVIVVVLLRFDDADFRGLRGN